MTAAVDDMSDQLDEQAPEGPGRRLKAARQAIGMDLERVAAQLHLKPVQVEALEKDDYSGFDARVFVRGYLRNYARLVGLPVDGVLDSFDAVYPDPDRPRELRRVGSHKPQVGSGHGVVRTVSWVLLLGILALFLVWWAGYLELNGGQDATSEDVVAEAGDDGQPRQAPGLLPVLPQPADLAEPAPAADGATPAEPAPLAEPAESAPVPPAAEPAPPVPAGDQAEPADRAEQAEAAPVADTAPPVAATGPQMVLTLSGPCWVQIRDSSGQYKMIGNYGAGTREVLGGEPPYKVLLGNAAVAELTVDGQPVDLTPHTRAQVARLTLTADTR